jgi:hypothetical protein
LPIGVSFIGGRWSEPQLIGFAYDFEQATHVRVPPTFIPSIGPDPVAAAATVQAQSEATTRHGHWAVARMR